MAYYDALKAKWATLSGTKADKLTLINLITVSGPNKDVAIGDVEGYMSLQGILTGLEDWLEANPTPSAARTAAKELLRTIASPHVTVFRTSDAATFASVSSMIGTLQAASLITQIQHDAILAMAATTVPWWQSAGYSAPVTQGDLDAAGGLT
jgi:hypothetical protein